MLALLVTPSASAAQVFFLVAAVAFLVAFIAALMPRREVVLFALIGAIVLCLGFLWL
jgi:hypothetical protein